MRLADRHRPTFEEYQFALNLSPEEAATPIEVEGGVSFHFRTP